FRGKLLSDPQIMNVAGSDMGLGEGMGWSRTGFEYEGKQKMIYEYFVDPYFIDALGMRIIAGRGFQANISEDTITSVVINEAMMRDFGWTTQNVIGKKIEGYMDELSPVVIGVVKDFNFRPFKEKIEPQLFQCFAGRGYRKFFVRLASGDPSKGLAAIEISWKEISSTIPL